jgi:hypothetical protein
MQIMPERTAIGELRLIKLRLLCVFLSRVKNRDKSTLSGGDIWLMRHTADCLLKAGIIDYCYATLDSLLDVWKSLHGAADAGISGSTKAAVWSWSNMQTDVPDLSPLFQALYVRENGRDVFGCYQLLLTEMTLRLPYQVEMLQS